MYLPIPITYLTLRGFETKTSSTIMKNIAAARVGSTAKIEVTKAVLIDSEDRIVDNDTHPEHIVSREKMMLLVS
jgi:hypothetical protein